MNSMTTLFGSTGAALLLVYAMLPGSEDLQDKALAFTRAEPSQAPLLIREAVKNCSIELNFSPDYRAAISNSLIQAIKNAPEEDDVEKVKVLAKKNLRLAVRIVDGPINNRRNEAEERFDESKRIEFSLPAGQAEQFEKTHSKPFKFAGRELPGGVEITENEAFKLNREAAIKYRESNAQYKSAINARKDSLHQQDAALEHFYLISGCVMDVLGTMATGSDTP